MARTSTATLAIVAALLLSACSSGDGRSPASEPQMPSASPSETLPTKEPNVDLPHSGAPKVENPLPASVRQVDPCTSFTPQQIETMLGVEIPGEPGRIIEVGPECGWFNVNTGASVDVNFITETRQGLSALYQKSKPTADLWTELPAIQGFPAVAHIQVTGSGPSKFCQVSIGLADDFSIDVSGSVSTLKVGDVDACNVTADAADKAVTTLKTQVAQ